MWMWFPLILAGMIYLAMPWIYVGLSITQNMWWLCRTEGRSLRMVMLASSLYVKVRDTLDLLHWPEALRMRNDWLRRFSMVFAWPLFLGIFADDIRGWRQFVHVHTFDERDPLRREYLECARLSETIGDQKGATEFKAKAALIS